MNNLCSVVRFNVKEAFEDKFVDACNASPRSTAKFCK